MSLPRVRSSSVRGWGPVRVARAVPVHVPRWLGALLIGLIRHGSCWCAAGVGVPVGADGEHDPWCVAAQLAARRAGVLR